MKLIWIINHYGESPTIGMNTRHYKFASELIKRGYDVRIFTASTVHRTGINYINDNSKCLEKEIKGVPFIFVRTCNYEGNGIRRIRNMMEYATRVLQITKKFQKPDVIYASSPHPLAWLSAYLIAKRYNAKFIAETRDLWPETLVAMGEISRNGIPAKILYKLEKFIYKNADKLVFTIEGGKDYVESIGLDISKVRYINNGVDIEEFNHNKESNIYKDEDLDNNNTFKILYTGSMGMANSLNHLIQAAELIQNKNYKDIQFILFGDGYQKIALEEYVENNNITNIVFKGKVEKKYIPNILNKSDLNVFAGKHTYLYKYGLSPNKIFEYYASGKPTLSNIECGYDMLEKYNCGMTVKGGSAEAFAEGILKFYNMSKEEYSNYCNNALKAVQDFDFKVLTDKLEKVILED